MVTGSSFGGVNIFDLHVVPRPAQPRLVTLPHRPPYSLPFQRTDPRLCARREFSKSIANSGRPKIARTLENQSKCARRMLFSKGTKNAISGTVAINARPTLRLAQFTLANPAHRINTPNSSRLLNASRRGFGNSSARFFVQPSHIWAKVRYMRVLTTSAV